MLCRSTNTDPLMTTFATTFTTIPGTQALRNPQGHHVCSSSGAPSRHEAGIIPQPLLNNTCQCLEPHIVLKITNMCWRATTPLSFKHLIMERTHLQKNYIPERRLYSRLTAVRRKLRCSYETTSGQDHDIPTMQGKNQCINVYSRRYPASNNSNMDK